MTAITWAAPSPRRADYRVVAEPDDTLVGTVNEDFAIESMAGDVFLLGSTSWRIRRVEAGMVRVVDARARRPRPVLARRGPGAHRRALRRGVRAPRERVERAPGRDGDRSGRGVAGRARRGVERGGGRRDRPLPRAPARAALGVPCRPSASRLRALLRRERRHAARGPRALRRPHQPRLGLALRKRFCVASTSSSRPRPATTPWSSRSARSTASRSRRSALPLADDGEEVAGPGRARVADLQARAGAGT